MSLYLGVVMRVKASHEENQAIIIDLVDLGHFVHGMSSLLQLIAIGVARSWYVDLQ
jgi:hypothetical protein